MSWWCGSVAATRCTGKDLDPSQVFPRGVLVGPRPVPLVLGPERQTPPVCGGQDRVVRGVGAPQVDVPVAGVTAAGDARPPGDRVRRDVRSELRCRAYPETGQLSPVDHGAV